MYSSFWYDMFGVDEKRGKVEGLRKWRDTRFRRGIAKGIEEIARMDTAMIKGLRDENDAFFIYLDKDRVVYVALLSAYGTEWWLG